MSITHVITFESFCTTENADTLLKDYSLFPYKKNVIGYTAYTNIVIQEKTKLLCNKQCCCVVCMKQFILEEVVDRKALYALKERKVRERKGRMYVMRARK